MWVFAFGTALLAMSTYVATFYALPHVVAIPQKHPRIFSVCLVGITSLSFASLSVLFPESALGNRIQHAVGGGALVVLIVLLVVSESGWRLTRLQFFILAVLSASTLGVAYELLEFLGEIVTPIVFQTAQYDTWLDLLSNSVGAVGAALVVSLFYPQTLKMSVQKGAML